VSVGPHPPWLSITSVGSFLWVGAEENAPLGGEATVSVQGIQEGESYSCSLNVSIASAECIDFI